MLSQPARVVHWARSVGQRFFFEFGLHCATHQIRVILISCVVITSLFYPALYSSSEPKLSSVLGAFHPPVELTAHHAQKDLVNLWSGYDSVRTHEDAVTYAKCGAGTALRVERIFIQSPMGEDDGAVNHRILFSTLELERRLEASIHSGDTPCLTRPDGACFVLSPLAFWNYDKDLILSDSNILDTLGNSQNVTIAGIPVSPPMVLAGRGSWDHPAKLDYATFLALTYFFPNSECLGNAEHAQWEQLVQDSKPMNAVVTPKSREPELIALDLNQDTPTGWSAISALVYAAYSAFFAYVVWSFRRMNAVHSRVGITFTALVEIVVSTITSTSVCHLIGLRITMVPLSLLPIVIVFVGAENMFNLVDAVGRTSVTLSVKQRIAEGMSKVGTSNTLKVVSYNTILGILAVFSAGAVQQFCTFAIIVLVAHWFLAHTFFMAVLSIDIARLELEELLRHDATLAPSLAQMRPTSQSEKENARQIRSSWEKFVVSAKSLLKGRATTNISLLMLLAITATLYYATYTNLNANQYLSKPLGGVARPRPETPAPSHKTTAEQIWHLLNPNQRQLVHIKLESPTILTINPESRGNIGPKGDKATNTRFSTTFQFVAYLLKIMVLPIVATTTALYGLLLYLLKDTERLEAQRHAEEDMVQEDEKALESHISFSTLPRAIPSDVELIASSKNGKVVVSVGLHNEIIVWNDDQQSYVSVDAADVLLSVPGSSSDSTPALTYVTVDDTGSLIAVGSSSGLIAVWVLVGTRITALPVLSLEGTSAAVTELHFVSQASPSPSTSERKLKIPPPSSPVLLATYENGTAARWSIERVPSFSRYSTSRDASVVKSFLLHVVPDGSVLVALSLDDGSLDLIETGDYLPMILNDHCMQPGTVFDTVSKAHACRTLLSGSARLVITVATEKGSVSLWDGLTGDRITVVDELQGKVNHLRISPVPSEACRTCGQPTPEALSIAYSVDYVIRIFNLYTNNQSRICSCSNGHMRLRPLREGAGRRSRSNSNANSRSGSPLIPRARLATAFEAADFPVSGHGVHSRRASEKEGRRSLDQLTVPFPTDDDGRCQNGTLTPLHSTSSLWQNAAAVFVGEVECQRGGWDVAASKFVGIRRRQRGQGTSKGGTATPVSLNHTHGLTTATLDRWELWTFDPALAKERSSVLSSLTLKPGGESEASSPSSSNGSLSSVSSSLPNPPPPPRRPSIDSIARLPFTRVSPLLVSPSHALAGFGNTIGVFSFSSSDL
ncbi:sterol-sensing domain of SREBP cleavage-activation-domain-containing protein [Ephemerocybe angulata]|uniref:Sterol regulatory element-binding protein cleavage-activating protein n=1 Tax=Ephemerocybe angulata TaxID=980116 RepID=A0A8H6IFR3_9AGAR|nr:sterol-sensing domain of SREBP cleavage-activation-domain-containing protein [Tulosesus angulatus]